MELVPVKQLPEINYKTQERESEYDRLVKEFVKSDSDVSKVEFEPNEGEDQAKGCARVVQSLRTKIFNLGLSKSIKVAQRENIPYLVKED